MEWEGREGRGRGRKGRKGEGRERGRLRHGFWGDGRPTCNISETGQDMRKITTDDQSELKSHTRYRLVPKSMTFEDLEELLRTLFQNTCVFGANHEI